MNNNDKKVIMGKCARCGVEAPIGIQEVEDNFIVPDKSINLCSFCIEELSVLEEDLVINKAEELTCESAEVLLAQRIEKCDARIEEISKNIALSNSVENSIRSKIEKPMLPSIDMLEKEVKKYVIGQDDAIRDIIVSIYRARMFEDMKANVLVIGKTGTGKTETIKQVAKLLSIPYTIEDATKYTEEGYVGEDVSSMITNLLDACDWDLERAKNGILIIDEIDKKASSNVMERDISGQSVLKSLLKIVEGTTLIVQMPKTYKEVAFDTSNLIIFFMGAFSGIEEIKKKNNGSKAIGFNSRFVNANKKHGRYTKQDLISYGMPDEFVGRIDTIVDMEDLKKDVLIAILSQSKLSIFKKYQKALSEKNIVLEYSDNLFSLIAEEAMEINDGARGLANVVNRIFKNILYEILNNSNEGVTKCTLLDEIMEDSSKYIFS